TEAQIDEALRQDPRNPWALFALAGTMVAKRRWDDAQQYVEQALALRPDEPRFVEGLGKILFLVDVKKADEPRWDRLDALRSRLVAPGASASALNDVAWNAAIRGRPDDGLELSRRSLAADPSCAHCYDTLAALLYEKGDVEAAIATQTLAVNLA